MGLSGIGGRQLLVGRSANAMRTASLVLMLAGCLSFLTPSPSLAQSFPPGYVPGNPTGSGGQAPLNGGFIPPTLDKNVSYMLVDGHYFHIPAMAALDQDPGQPSYIPLPLSTQLGTPSSFRPSG